MLVRLQETSFTLLFLAKSVVEKVCGSEDENQSTYEVH